MTTFAFPSITYILYIAGMLERGEIDVALADLSLTFPRAQVKKKKKNINIIFRTFLAKLTFV